MKDKINIIYKHFDEENDIVIFKKNNRNVYFDFGLYNFESEMEHWDLPTQLVDDKGEKGFLFSKKLDRDDIDIEIRRFIMHNELDSEIT